MFGYIILWSFPSGLAGETVTKTSDFLEVLNADEARLLQNHSGSGATLPPAGYFGTDPYQIEYLDKYDRYLIMLRNSSEVLLCDSNLNVLDRHSTPNSPVAWDLLDHKWLFIGGELSSTIQIYTISETRLTPVLKIELENSVSIRNLVYVEAHRSFYILDDFNRRLIWIRMEPEWMTEKTVDFEKQSFPVGAGALNVRSIGNNLIINLFLEHRILILPLINGKPEFESAAKISNTGPFWNFSAAFFGQQLVIAAGGVENRPLNRRGGEFGYVDSFLYLFALDKDSSGAFRWKIENRSDPNRFRAINLSEIGIVTPKAVRFQPLIGNQMTLWVAGFGGDKLAEYRLDALQPHLFQTWDIIPGVTDFVVRSDLPSKTIAMVSTLLDQVAIRDLKERRTLRKLNSSISGSIGRSPEIQMGELLFFTTLLTPVNRTAGELSRFTCETCHFEGTIDGRTHFTGRDDIHATSKTLRGLANNVPLFSRAGSKSLASMVVAEFEVANQERKDIFSVRQFNYPWLSELESLPKVVDPLQLRRSFLAFFTVFEHRPNPWRFKYKALDSEAKKGLDVFRKRCEDCHHAIETTRTADAVSFEHWETWLTENRLDLVWGAPFLCKTGITPYPDVAGTRVPSLRRVWLKYPYFTSGSSKTLEDVLKRFRYQGATAWHQYDGKNQRNVGIKKLTSDEISALEALLRYF